MTTTCTVSCATNSQIPVQIQAQIDLIRTIERANEVARIVNEAYAQGFLGDDAAQAALEAVEAVRQQLRDGGAAAVREAADAARHSGGKSKSPTARRGSIFPPTRKKFVDQRSRAERIALRRTLAAAAPVPPQVARHFSLSELAVLRIIADQHRDFGRCTLHVAEIARRAGVGRTTVQNAIRKAECLEMVVKIERRVRGDKNQTNVVVIRCRLWLRWLARGPKRSQAVSETARGGGFKIKNPISTHVYSKGSTGEPHCPKQAFLARR